MSLYFYTANLIGKQQIRKIKEKSQLNFFQNTFEMKVHVKNKPNREITQLPTLEPDNII